MPRSRYLLPLLCLLAWGRLGLGAEPVLTLLYFERPPFYQTRPDGGAGGELIERSRAMAALAGEKLRLESVPPGRILAELKANSRAFCTPGWFYTAERAGFARFSPPLYRDQPFLVLVRKDFATRRAWTLDALMSDPSLSLGVVNGFSYGRVLDARIARRPGRVDRTVSVEKALRVEQNLEKLRQGRIDFLFVNREEWLSLHRDQEVPDLVHLTPPDMPAGEFRYLVCSYKVAARRVDAFGAALERLWPELAEAERREGSLRLTAGAARP